MLMVAAVVLAKKMKAKLIVDIQDIWPEAFYLALPKYYKGLLKLAFSPFELLNRYCFSQTDKLCISNVCRHVR